VPVFDLARSYRNVRSGKVQKMSGKGLEKIRKFIFKIAY